MDLIAQGFVLVWMDSSVKLSEWTNKMITSLSIYLEFGLSVALLLDGGLCELCNIYTAQW